MGETTMWLQIELFCLVALVYGNVEIERGVDSRIGYGFHLHEKDIMGVFTGGAAIFKSVPSHCIIKVDGTKAERLTSYYDSTESFFQRISGDTQLSVSLKGKYTMGFTLNIKSTGIFSEMMTVIGSSVRMASYKHWEILSKECENKLELSDDFVRDFEALPDVVNNPQSRSSWDKFDFFLRKYGSHYVTETSFGAYMEQWTFAKAEKRYSKSQLEARACGDFAGPTKVGQLNIATCAGFTSTEIYAAQSLDASSSITVKGGNSSLAHALL